MKQSIILWTAAAIITFVAGFLQSRLSSDYPISGSFGIEGKEIGYKLDKSYYGNDDYKFLLKSEIDSLQGKVYWKSENSREWYSSELKDSAGIITGRIPHGSPLSTAEYYIMVNYKNKSYNIPPNNKPVTLSFYGKIPASINFYYFITLLGAILLAVRTGLEYFKVPGKLKKIEIFTLIFVISNVFVFNPVRITYMLGSVGKTIIPLTAMFPLSSILLLATWILATILIFNTKNFRIWAPAAAIITLIIFETGKF